MFINARRCYDAALVAHSGAKPVVTFTTRRRRQMRLRNPNRFAASGRKAVLVLAGMLFLGSGIAARAQSDGDNSQRGLEGAWRLQITIRDCNTGQALRTFPAVFT